jgi:tRNA (cytidine32/uridine32-2'-O)-methyltransferase
MSLAWRAARKAIVSMGCMNIPFVKEAIRGAHYNKGATIRHFLSMSFAGDTVLENVRIVLVNISHPGNIGAIARAMKNMGLHDLCLISPERFPDGQARAMAANAKDVLDGARVVETLDEAIGDCHLVIGTSARERSIPWPLLDARECADTVLREEHHHKIAILFGREDSGLTNEELQRCHYHLHIPTSNEYGALNVAAAAQIVCYELRMRALVETVQPVEPIWDVEFATAKEVELFFQHLEEAMTEVGFLDPKAPRQLITRLRRLYNRVRLDHMEVQMLRGILSHTQQLKRNQKLTN